MKTITLTVSILTLAFLAAVSTVNGDGKTTPPETRSSVTEVLPAIPATPAAVDHIVYARKFTLEKGFEFGWCKEHPNVTTGYLLVLQVNPDLVFARARAEPVLYVGSQSAQRLNNGYKSGHVIAIAPGDVDLEKALIWFGTPGLPGSVDVETANAELALAKNAGIRPFSTTEVKAALARGSKELKGAHVVDVLRAAADLIRQYSPAEKDQAKTLVPAPKLAPKPAPNPRPDDEE